MFTHTDENGNFIIESGSSAVPIMKVSGSVVYISGSLLPFESSDSAFSEIGSLAKPFKELYVESASINFVDTSKAVNHADRRSRFSKIDVDKLKRGESINDSGHISASGDFHVVGRSHLKGITLIEGNTTIEGATTIDGLTDIKGGFKINGQEITDEELRALRGFSHGDGDIQTQINSKHNVINANNRLNATLIGANGNISNTEYGYLNGVTGSIQTQLNSKISTLNLVDEDNMASNSATKVPSQQSVKAYVDANAGGGTIDSSITDGSTNAVQNNAVHDALALKATTAGVAGDLLPDADGTRDLGASDKEWQDLYVDGIAYTDSISNAGTLSTVGFSATGDLTSRGLHILGGAGAVTISQIPTNGVLDARAANVFYMGVDGTINGINGSRIMGQVVTIIQPFGRRNTFTHQSTNANVHSTWKFVLVANRDLNARGPQAIRFIYDGTVRCWYRLI